MSKSMNYSQYNSSKYDSQYKSSKYDSIYFPSIKPYQGKAMQLIDVRYNEYSQKISTQLNAKCLQLIIQNFSRLIPICIIAFGGTVGMGKSTALSALCIILDIDIQKTGEEIFQSSSQLESATKGIWCYPKPLYLQNKQVQILLIDVEGMGAVGSIPKDKQKEIENKINLLAMILSSQYVMISGIRPDEASIQQMNQVFLNLRDLKEDLEISPPHISLLIKDREDDISEKERLEFMNKIQVTQELPEQLANNISLFKLEQLNKKQLKNKDYRCILQEDYTNCLSVLIQKIGKQFKTNLVVDQFITVQQYCQLIQQSVDCINSENFSVNFIQNLEEYVLELTQPIYEQFEKNLTIQVEYNTCQNVIQFDILLMDCLDKEYQKTINSIKNKVPRISNSKNPKHQKLLDKIYTLYYKRIQTLINKFQKTFELQLMQKQFERQQQELTKEIKEQFKGQIGKLDDQLKEILGEQNKQRDEQLKNLNEIIRKQDIEIKNLQKRKSCCIF